MEVRKKYQLVYVTQVENMEIVQASIVHILKENNINILRSSKFTFVSTRISHMKKGTEVAYLVFFTSIEPQILNTVQKVIRKNVSNILIARGLLIPKYLKEENILFNIVGEKK